MGFFGVEDDRRSQDIKQELILKSDFYIKDFDLFIDEGFFNKFFVG